MVEIKDRIRKLRLQKGLNQPELARIMNVSKQTISNWENGNRIPDTLTIKKLADFFNVSTDYILDKDNQLSSLSNIVIDKSKINKNNTLSDDFVDILVQHGKIKSKKDLTPKIILQLLTEIFDEIDND